MKNKLFKKFLIGMVIIATSMCMGGCKVIGPDGGTLTESGVTIAVPEGVLAGPVRMSVKELPVDIILPDRDVLKTFVLEPHGTEFVPGTDVNLDEITDLIELQEAIDVLLDAPLSIVSVIIPGFGTGNLRLLTQDDNDNWYFVADTHVSQDSDTGLYTLTANLNHFSNFAVVDGKLTTTPTPWHEGVPYDVARPKILALKAAWAVATTDTDEKYSTYLLDTLNPLNEDDSLKLEPYGPKSCDHAANVFMSELKQREEITAAYEVTTENTGVIAQGVSQPIPHYAARLSPLDGVGPDYIVDRYTFVRLHQITDELMTKEDNTEHDSFLEQVYRKVIDTYLTVETFENTGPTLDLWEVEIQLTKPIEYVTTLCTVVMGTASDRRCPVHNYTMGSHCIESVYVRHRCPSHSNRYHHPGAPLPYLGE